jgi:hypothetical protein
MVNPEASNDRSTKWTYARRWLRRSGVFVLMLT